MVKEIPTFRMGEDPKVVVDAAMKHGEAQIVDDNGVVYMSMLIPKKDLDTEALEIAREIYDCWVTCGRPPGDFGIYRLEAVFGDSKVDE